MEYDIASKVVIELAKEAILRRRRDIMIQSAAYEIIKEEGIKEGMKEGMKETLLAVLDERFGIIPISMINNIGKIKDTAILELLHRQAIRCKSLEEFEQILEKM